MKKRVLSVLVALVMCLSLLPTALAAEKITVNEYGHVVTDETENYPSGITFEKQSSTYLLGKGEYEFTGGSLLYPVIANNSTIIGGSFSGHVTTTGNATIQNGTFDGTVYNSGAGNNVSTITGGTFNALVTNYGTIEGGMFNGGILNYGTVESISTTKIANVGNLGLTTQVLGTDSIFIQQNGVKIPENAGKAGETYNVAGFEALPIGLYLLTDGETAPTENFTIESDFRAVAGGAGGYDFTMPNEAVTVLAVFADYEAPSTTTYTVTYTDGVEGEEIFEDLSYSEISFGSPTPAYEGTPTRPGFTFAGWSPAVAETVTGNAIYTAQWTENTSVHTHEWSSEWSADEWFHWYDCTADGCDLTASDNDDKKGFDWHEITNDTHVPGREGAHKGTCSICGRENSLNYKYEYIRNVYNDTQHWNECGCGVKESFGEHWFDDGADMICDGCGYERAITPPSSDDDDDYTPPVADDDDDTPTDPPVSPVTVPVSGDENSIQVGVVVSGTTAIIDDIDLSALHTVIGSHVDTGVVGIDLSGLNKGIDTVKLPADVLKAVAEAANNPDNDATSLKILFASGTSIEFDAKALDGKSEQMGGKDIAISVKDAAGSALNTRQQQTIGSRPALDIHITSGGRRISDFGGEMRIQTPYTLLPGERAEGIVVFYVDDTGSKERCETDFDSQANIVSWVTSHNSVYMIDHVENLPITVLPPKTGEAPSIAGFLMLALGLLGCGAMAIRRRSDG